VFTVAYGLPPPHFFFPLSSSSRIINECNSLWDRATRIVFIVHAHWTPEKHTGPAHFVHVPVATALKPGLQFVQTARPGWFPAGQLHSWQPRGQSQEAPVANDFLRLQMNGRTHRREVLKTTTHPSIHVSIWCSWVQSDAVS